MLHPGLACAQTAALAEGGNASIATRTPQGPALDVELWERLGVLTFNSNSPSTWSDMGVSWIGGTPKWMVYKGPHPIEMDDFGVPPFQETPISML